MWYGKVGKRAKARAKEKEKRELKAKADMEQAVGYVVKMGICSEIAPIARTVVKVIRML